MNIFEYDDVSIFLKDTIEHLKLKNPHFSLRAFAKRCGVSPSLISAYISGKSEVSIKTAEKISLALSLNEAEYNFFLKILSKKHSKTLTSKDDGSLKASLEYQNFIKSFLEKSRVLGVFDYCDQEMFNFRKLILFGNTIDGKFNGTFCDSVLYLKNMQIGYNYHIPNNDGTYRTYATTNNQQFSPFLQGEENKSLKVTFDEFGFPTVHDAYLSVPHSKDDIFATIFYSKDKASVTGRRSTKGKSKNTPILFEKVYKVASKKEF